MQIIPAFLLYLWITFLLTELCPMKYKIVSVNDYALIKNKNAHLHIVLHLEMGISPILEHF